MGAASVGQAAGGGRQGMAQALNVGSHDLDWAGQGVTIAQVLDALTEFRHRFARTGVADDDHPHPRNCVMTLIAVAEAEAEEKKAERDSTAIAVHHPSLAIVVRDQADVKAGRIDAYITAPEVAYGSASPMHYELVK